MPLSRRLAAAFVARSGAHRRVRSGHPGGQRPAGADRGGSGADWAGAGPGASGEQPVTNTSVNPGRSTGPALFVGGWAITQMWLFWIAPLLGAALAGLGHRYVTCCPDEPDQGAGESVECAAPTN